ncbi:Lrp/AsnC family transcriptional regulator [Microvirga antarctica]|uniref:Lrp/AsnC family transcriptional regulator n=1 Tax=Microvirga antarctica TaxID=2819233 RepID=UPI001B306D9F
MRNETPADDEVNRTLIAALIKDARLSVADLARSVDMSAPAVADRLRKLEEAGLIGTYTIDADLKAWGYPLIAIVRIKPLPGQLHMVERILVETPEVIECDKVTGDDCFIARYALRSIDELDPMLDRIAQRAQTSTAIVKASPVRRRMPSLPGA